MTMMMLPIGSNEDAARENSAALGIRDIPRAAEVVLYNDADFHGEFLRTNLGMNFSQDDGRNDEVSSIIVVSGRWKFCVDSYLRGQCVVLGPGYYANEREIGLPNDSISSFQMISY